jgi:predicted transcriptional regulator
MARPKASELTERELELMQVFWDEGEMTAADVQKKLASNGRELAYTTVATLVKILLEKKFLTQTSDKRPFSYKPAKSFEEVSSNIVGNMIQKVFGGSREQLLIRMMEQKKLTKKERKALEDILKENQQ